MNLALASDQLMIRDAAQSFLADASNSVAVRAAMQTEDGFDAQVWSRIGGELGWCGTAIPEDLGGLGLGPVELVLILEQMGRHLLCSPFFGTVCLAGTALTVAANRDAQQRYLPRLAAGTLRATALLESTELVATSANGRWTLAGRADAVLDAPAAQLLLLVARVADGRGLFAAERDAPGLAVEPLATWDATRRVARVRLQNVSVERIDEPAGEGGGRIGEAVALARLYVAAEQLGAAQQCLDLAVAYARERRQFGRAIASFQAVKHRCAEMMVRVEALRSAVYGCAAFAAATPAAAGLATECAMARALAADTLFHCAQEAIQLHGGVGFTWDFDPQLYFKRAQASSHWLGTADAMRETIARAVIG